MPLLTNDEYTALLLAGRMMSNICFNGKQDVLLPLAYRRSMNEAQQRWDAIADHLAGKKRQSPKRER